MIDIKHIAIAKAAFLAAYGANTELPTVCKDTGEYSDQISTGAVLSLIVTNTQLTGDLYETLVDRALAMAKEYPEWQDAKCVSVTVDSRSGLVSLIADFLITPCSTFEHPNTLAEFKGEWGRRWMRGLPVTFSKQNPRWHLNPHSTERAEFKVTRRDFNVSLFDDVADLAANAASHFNGPLEMHTLGVSFNGHTYTMTASYYEVIG